MSVEPYQTLADLEGETDEGALALSELVFEDQPRLKGKVTAMDIMLLADAVMLHEMTHIAIRGVKRVLDYVYGKTSEFVYFSI